MPEAVAFRQCEGDSWGGRSGVVDSGYGVAGKVAALSCGPFVVLHNEDRTGQALERGGVGEHAATTSVRRVIPLFTRSSGLVDYSYPQCALGNAQTVRASVLASVMRVWNFGNWRPSNMAMVSNWASTSPHWAG